LTTSSPIRVVDEGYTGESENTAAGMYPESRLKVPSANLVTYQASVSRSSSTPTIPTIPLSMKPQNQLDSTIQSITYNIGSTNTQHQPSNYIGNAQVDTSMQSQNAAEDQEYYALLEKLGQLINVNSQPEAIHLLKYFVSSKLRESDTSNLCSSKRTVTFEGNIYTSQIIGYRDAPPHNPSTVEKIILPGILSLKHHVTVSKYLQKPHERQISGISSSMMPTSAEQRNPVGLFD